MAQPPSYNREKNFADDFGNETDHSSLNAELDRASNSINDIRANLAILQADDGKLRPAVVTADSISEELRVSLVEGVVMDAQAMLDRSLAAADASSASAAAAKASEKVALECKVSAVQSATSAQQSAAEAAESAGEAKQVNADWNATSGKAQILNKPTTLAGLELADIHTRVKSAAYSVGDVVIAPYLEDAILVCTTAGTTSGEELSRDIVIAGSDIEDGSVVWNVRNKFSTGLKQVEGTVSLDSHASQTGEYGCGNEQYFGHVKVVDDCFSNRNSADSVAISPYGAITAINNAMLGKNAGVITESTTWVCKLSGTYNVILVGGGGGGGGGANYGSYSWSTGSIVNHDRKTYTTYGTGGGGGGGGAAGVTIADLSLSAGESLQISIAAGGGGGSIGNNGGEGGITSVTKLAADGTATDVSYTAGGGGGGYSGKTGSAWQGGSAGGAGGAAGINHMEESQAATGGGSGVACPSGTGLKPGGNGGTGAFIGTSSVYSRFGNGGGGGHGNGAAGSIAGSANELAAGGNGVNGGNGAQGMVYITLSEI